MEGVLWKMISNIYRFHDWICSSYQLLDNAVTICAMEQLQYLTEEMLLRDVDCSGKDRGKWAIWYISRYRRKVGRPETRL
jgi:hypothetical protein